MKRLDPPTRRAKTAPASPVGKGPRALAVSSPIPLYYQIANVLQARIYSGVYPLGSLLGTEEELARVFGVSRVTVRNAIGVLAELGLVDRRRARGTFISADIRPRPAVQLHGFLEDVLLLGDFGRTIAEEHDETPAPADVAARLGIAAGLSIFRIRRVRSLSRSHEPDTWIENYLPLDIGRALDPARLSSDSLIQLLDERPDFHLTAGYETISAVSADSDVAARLHIAPGSPILVLERGLQTAAGRTVDFARFHQRGDRYRYSVRLSRISR
ncbi:MAG TPA: GntR family transcriptional regulator [Chloroflexota bacterium]|nr:GntR family transcriptional regulator [Chloroflexota bacterium]